MNKKLPFAKSENVVVQELSDEILIYDTNSNKAYYLNKTAAAVFAACGAGDSFDELKKREKFSEEIIYFALDELKKANLIDEKHQTPSYFDNLSRREVVRKIGFGSMVALPMIYTLIAPNAINAQSASVYTCANPGASTVNFCTSSPADCASQAKSQCATCGATASTTGLCSSNTTNTITCTCGGACSNPGTSIIAFCASPATGCSQARDLCRNCSATGSTTGLCSANPVTTLTCTCV